MTRTRANEILNRARDGDEAIDAEDIREALRATGDLADDSWAHATQEIA